MRAKWIFFLLAELIPLVVLSQRNDKINSLLTKLKTSTDDSAKVNTLNLLSEEFINAAKYDTAVSFSGEALRLSQRINFVEGEGDAYMQMGMVSFYRGTYSEANGFFKKAELIYRSLNYQKGIARTISWVGIVNLYEGNYPAAKELFIKAIEMQTEISDKAGVAKSYYSIGEVYQQTNEYPDALRNFLSGLKIYEELNNKQGIGDSYSNIGLIYKEQGNFEEALKNELTGLKIVTEVGDKNGIAQFHNNLGIIYFAQKNYSEALKNHQIAMGIRKEIGYKKGISDSYFAIAEIYRQQDNLSEALENHRAALVIEEEIGYKLGIAESQIYIGLVYLRQKKFKEAIENLNVGLKGAKEIGYDEDVKIAYEGLAHASVAVNDFENAYRNYKLYSELKDALMNGNKIREMSKMQFGFEQDKKDALTQAEIKKQRILRNSFIGGFAIVLLFAGVFFRQRNNISKEKKRSDELLLNILPSETAEELKHTGAAKTKTYEMVTVMFTDFKNFTQASEKLSPEELVKEIHDCYSEFDRIIAKHNLEKIKTIGDSYMCAGGLPVANTTNPVDTVLAAVEIRNFMLYRKHSGLGEFEIRIGVHSGPIVAGVVGIKKFAYDIWGDTVNIASRMESSGEVGKVNISGATYELVKEKFKCEYRGKVSAKNKGEVDMYFAETVRSQSFSTEKKS
jgi:adenylate cyclase